MLLKPWVIEIGKRLISSLLWCCLCFNFPQCVILENVSILDLAMSCRIERITCHFFIVTMCCNCDDFQIVDDTTARDNDTSHVVADKNKSREDGPVYATVKKPKKPLHPSSQWVQLLCCLHYF